MATRDDIGIYITAKDQYSKIMTKAQQSAQKLQRNWVAAAGVMAGASIAIGKAWDSVDMAAKADQQAQAFTNMAASHGANARDIVASLKMMSGHTISNMEIMKQAGTAMTLGISEEMLPQMMEVARASARVMGATTEEMFEKLTVGLARQSKLRLDDLGIIVDVGKANEEYARSIGLTVNQLTDAQKKQAFFNASMESGQDIVKRSGEMTMDAAEAIQIFTAQMKNAKVWVGKALISVSSFLGALASGVGAAFTGMLFVSANAVNDLLQLLTKIPVIGKKFEGAADFVEGYADQMRVATSEALNNTKALGEMTVAVWKQKEATVGLMKTERENIAQKEAVADRLKKIELATIKGMASKAELAAMDLEEFRSMGANTEQVNRYIDAKRTLATFEEEEAAKKAARQQLKTLEAKDPFKAIAEDTTGMTEFERRQLEHEREMEQLRVFAENKLTVMQTLGQSEEEILRTGTEMKMLYAQKQADFDLEMAEASSQGKLDIAQKLISAGLTHSKKSFKLQQAFGIGQAIIDTYMGVNKALGSAPPPLNFALAGAVMAAGMANVAKIKNQKPGGGAGGGSIGGGGGGGGMARRPSAMPLGRPEAAEKGAQSIQINVHNPLSEQNWDAISADIVGAINKAGERNMALTIRTVEE